MLVIICTINNILYYMALSHKDWELPNSLPEMDIDRGLDFPIQTGI